MPPDLALGLVDVAGAVGVDEPGVVLDVPVAPPLPPGQRARPERRDAEALVRLGAVLRPGGVREDLLEPVGGQVLYEAAELGRPGVGLDLSPDAR